MNLSRLGRKLSYILRHAPWEYELELDEEGWVPLSQLIESLQREAFYKNVSRQDFEAVIDTSSKSRFEMKGDYIRALYGHSVPGKLMRQPATPPTYLYHGTQTRFLPAIREQGLRPMARQYVHLSVVTTMAQSVGSRRGPETVILQIRAGEAAEQQITFYEGNAQVWLADIVPPEFILFP